MVKNIIITGTSRGIGHELALQFANAGHNVLAISRKKSDRLLANAQITCLSVDLSEQIELEKVNQFLTQNWS
ncbi:MAG: SDR family NAD(P)-dependent oxidoreductase, partial [Flavobacterium sp.]|nr:SDR family NAD(P)-dependent oxidoreductase [Flavobacterium sp.]